MDNRIKKLCGLCREVDKAYFECGVLTIGGSSTGKVHLTEEAFFELFDKWETSEMLGVFKRHYRVVDGICFFCVDTGRAKNVK